jgi:sugar phosphate isomerase/epimerase
MQLRRRSFMAGMAAAGAGLAVQSAARAEGHPVRLGGPIFRKSDDPEELAREHVRLGYKAAYCPEVSLGDQTRIHAVAKAFSAHAVTIAEVGRWVNLLDPNPTQRKENLQKVTDGLALADAIGVLCCVDIAGSFSTTSWFGPHPENLSTRFFDAAVENARKIIDSVHPKRSKFCYEMMGWSLPDSAQSALDLVKAVDRKAFGVHLDPCNLINCPSRFYQSSQLLAECFDKLGSLIVSCHAKDLTWNVEMNVHFQEVPPGRGSLDYAVYLKRLAGLAHQPPLMLEHLSGADDYDRAREHIRAVGKRSGVAFE